MYQKNINPFDVPEPPVKSCEPVACIERHAVTTTTVSIQRGQALARSYARLWRPERYYCNLMPGLPLWLLWPWQRAGVPCTAVVREGQLAAFDGLRELLHDAWSLCDDHVTVGGLEERDETCRTNGTLITVEHVLHRAAP